jgi:hypothetical protein
VAGGWARDSSRPREIVRSGSVRPSAWPPGFLGICAIVVPIDGGMPVALMVARFAP